MIPFKEKSVILAPMAGITDSGFRKICIECGADAVFSEMVSSKGLFYHDKKSYELLEYSECETPISLQIFGSEPECMKVAAEYITENYSPASIDINMGCPAPKIFQNGDGSALMKKPELAFEIISAVKNNTDLPVSVKFRSGIDKDSINAVDFALMCEQAKADFITIHGRTREQFYSGRADIDIIKEVVNAVKIPTVANGDIIDGESAKHMLEYTGAHSIMIGRAALGNPNIFNEIKSYIFDTKSDTNQEKLDIALKHLKYTIAEKGEFIAVKEFRKHLMWYMKGIKNAAKLKQLSCKVCSYADCEDVINTAKAFGLSE